MQKHLFCMQSRRSDICVRVCACAQVRVGLCCSPTGQNKTSKTSRLSFINANQCIGNEACESRDGAGCCKWMPLVFKQMGLSLLPLAPSRSLTPAAF